MTDKTVEEWWRDPRCHFGKLTETSPLLSQRSDLQPAIELITAELDLEEGSKILDLCCGPGRYAIELAHQGFDVVGIDLNEAYVALAQIVARRERVAIDVLVGDARDVPFVGHFPGLPQEEWSHSWRAYTLAELVTLLTEAGLDVHKIFGGWEYQDYGVDSRRMLVISRKR